MDVDFNNERSTATLKVILSVIFAALIVFADYLVTDNFKMLSYPVFVVLLGLHVLAVFFLFLSFRSRLLFKVIRIKGNVTQKKGRDDTHKFIQVKGELYEVHSLLFQHLEVGDLVELFVVQPHNRISRCDKLASQ